MSDYQEQQQKCQRSDILDGPISFGERDDDEQSIIDVFEFDDTADDRWLCSTGVGSRRNSVEIKIQDLDAWLHADVSDTEITNCENSLRKNIDSRTFTRIKRRSNKLNFDLVEASVSSEIMPFSLSNVWKNQTISESASEEQCVQKESRDNVPMMLRPKTNQVLAALLSESPSSISSQTSMEAFVNMARSKEGLNSLLSDMSESDVNHILMNISQPSLLYSSIISDGKGDENVQSAVNDSFIDSQILTDSMMEASMFKEVQDTTILAEFLKQSNDSTIFEDKTICKSFNGIDVNDKIFDDNCLSDKVYSSENLKLNETLTNLPSEVNENEMNSTKIITSQENLLNALQVNTNTCSSLNSTKVISFDHDTTVLLHNKDILSTMCKINKENKTDLMPELNSIPSHEEQLDITFEKSDFPVPQVSQLSGITGIGGNSLDTTFNAVPSLRAELLQEVQRSTANKFDSTFDSAQLPDIETNLDMTYNCLNTVEPIDEVEVLDVTYVQVPSLHTLESPNVKKNLDTTYNFTQTNTKINNSFGARHISYAKQSLGEYPMHLADQNRFNTFKKDSKIGSCLSKVPQENYSNKTIAAPLQSHVPSAKSNDNLYQQRFNTFSKKMSIAKNKICIENNMNDTKPEFKFSKPLDKLPRQTQAPRQLSKLPQLFQKSNPNLGTSLKSVGKLTMESEVEFSKGSQPNISRNMYSLSRFKSERILETTNNIEFSVGDSNGGSMESIESTASAHSAPDIDDRLSISSESSRASYTIKPNNIETLNKLSNIKKQDVKIGVLKSKIKERHILENTWVEDKNLPSPIPKNNIRSYAESGDSRSTSPSDSAEFNAKTSSPLTISPASSDQAINKIGSDDGGIEVRKENIEATINIKPQQIKVPSLVSTMVNTTKLRRPTNWTGAPNKIANSTVSGIPRPASRIPALKFTRPNLK